MAVRIIVDSTSDYTPKDIERLGLMCAPLTLHWDGQEYRDGVDMTPAEFFARLVKSSSLPTTSQVPVPVFGDQFAAVVADGDEALVMTLSHNLSGTYQSATIARESMGAGSEQIHLFDTGSGSLGSMLIINEAIRLRDSGKTAAEIISELESARDRLAIYACVETLKFLHKGGRLSTGAAVVGSMLSVKPVLCIEDGLIAVPHKVRGSAAAFLKTAQSVAEIGIDPAYPITIGSTQCPELLAKFTASIKAETGTGCDCFCDIGPVIGTHVGPGTVGIAFIKAKK